MQISRIQAIQPFRNNDNRYDISNMKITNGEDEIIISGELRVNKDRNSLENILALKRQVDSMAEYLKRAHLTE